MKRILFVCIENAGRSQMAEAFARIHGKETVEPYSAGSRPSGKINPKAIEAMRERGCDLTQHRSKSPEEIPSIEYDVVVTMGCRDACPFVRSKRREEWDIPDPKDSSIEGVRKIRDLIEEKVKILLLSLA